MSASTISREHRLASILGRKPVRSFSVRAATAGDGDHVAQLLAAADLHHPVLRWLDTSEDRAEPLVPFDRIVAEALMSADAVVHLTEDGTGAAVWYDHCGDDSSPLGYGVEVLATHQPLFRRRADLLRELLIEQHPVMPHWHLGYLAVTLGEDYTRVACALISHHTIGSHQASPHSRWPARSTNLACLPGTATRSDPPSTPLARLTYRLLGAAPAPAAGQRPGSPKTDAALPRIVKPADSSGVPAPRRPATDDIDGDHTPPE